ncbi:beta strand repeat-containing protein [Flavobacterium sp.]|jgi:hypothetical protein|uniref:beta strand repeat-containing protein n=1 Tax=Flavobacterium sp. TaxID=239 RepID=UPI0037BE385C
MTNFYKIGVTSFQSQKKQKSILHVMFTFFMFFFVIGVQAQTTIINPATDGGFNLGNTFAANGWTVANQGVSPVKWAVGAGASGTSQSSTLNATTAVTLSAPNSGIVAGQLVYGNGIPANTYVVSVTGTSLVLSQAATVSGTNTLGFGVFTGGISVGTTQQTNTTAITAGAYTLTLSAANPSISVGMLITPNAFIGANTYVASINGTALGLSNATTAAAAASQTLTFTATSSAISGNAAYISNDNGATNSYGGYPTTRTVYFYKDVTVPAAEKAMTLTFDVKSAPASGGGWQVFVAPTSQTVTGTDTQVTLPFTYLAPPAVIWPGATLISFNSNPQVATTKTTAFIPKSFAGTSFRLIFVWTHGTSPGTLPPAAIDNISLTSRIPEEITCAQSGLWSQPITWTGGKVPTPADGAVLDSNAEAVMIDSRYTGCEDLTLAGTNTLIQFAVSTVVDEFTVNNDLNIAASGARFNNHDGTNGKHLKLGHNLDVGVGARFDSNLGSATFQGRLTLNGSTVQNVTVDPAGFFGGSVLQTQTAASTNANQVGVLNQLDIDNTATAASNVVWNVPVTRIKSNLFLRNARVNVTTGNRFVIGNFGNLLSSNLVCNSGSGFTNGLVSKWLLSGNTYNVTPGTEYPGLHNDSNPYRFPFISPSGADRTFYVLPDGNASPAGEIAVLYTHSNTVTSSLSIADGSYTINKRFEGNYTVSTPNASATPIAITYTPNATTPTFRIGAYLNGAFEALDGTARFMNQSAALAGTHQDGTNKPFVFRKGLTLAQLTAAPIFVGVNNSGILTTSSNIVSAATGDWNATATWVGGVVPGCTDGVTIASGHTVTVTTTANVANLVINSGGTLVNNSATNNMTVGCTNNNAIFSNYGTHTITSGKLFVNGAVAHKAGSFFNQTGGEIIVDSNNNGAAATSVAFGGTSFKLETSNLNLTDGKITIVDPLVNIETTAISATSIANFSLNTQGAAGVFVKTTTSVLSTNSFTTSNSGGNMIAVGQVVTGHANIPAGTTVLSTSVNFAGTVNTVTLSQNVTGSIPSGTDLNFSSMLNGNTSIVIENAAGNANLAVGQVVSGNGIQTGTTIASIAAEFGGPARVRIVLSLPVLGLATSPITAPVTLSFSAVNVGSPVTVLTAANPSIQIGMPVTGTGILPGTIVANIEGAVLTLSEPVQSGAPNPLVLNFYTFNTLTSGSFIYNSTNHYATGLNHTLQIGDGVSTQNTSIITNGFNCQFQAGGGLLSLGNLTVDAPNGAERFMNVSSNNINSGTVPAGYNFNVQNNFTITPGSVFNKILGNAPVYVGGNIINNGTLNMPRGGNLYLGNIINGALTPSAIPQTISGSGTYLANEYNLNGSNLYNAHSVGSLTVNNTSAAGVTIGVPNFRVNGLTLTNGIVHTTASNTIYCGAPDVLNTSMTNGTFGFSPNVVGSATCHIDGPIIHSNKADASITQNRLFPVGKNGKYLPISVASTGGVELMVEAFDTNTGTTSANASNMSANRWKVTRVGTAGAFTGYNVRLGSLNNPVTPSNLIVHAATDSGVYDIVSTPASLMTYDAAHFSITNLPTIALTTAQTGGFLGNFSYANGAACTGTPTPGATIASTTTACAGQPVTLSLTTPTTGSNVTYQWQNSTNGGTTWNNILNAASATLVTLTPVITSYRCIVTCSSNTGTSTPVVITPEVSSAVVPNVTTNCSKIANLIASGSSQFYWYTAATGGNVVATGASYSSTLTATTNYYVASVTETANTINTVAFAGTTAGTTLFAGITFDVTKPIKLKTVRVYPKNTTLMTPISISLYDETGNVVTGTSAVTFIPSLNTGNAGIVSQDITLNYNIPVGNGYRLVVSNGVLATTNNSLGNSTATISYPSGTTLVLKGNVTSLTAAPVTTNNTTTYFHNLTFDEICESVTRTSVTATLNTVTPLDVPTIITTAATCSAAGTSTVSNYSASLTYTFSPSGPSVSTGGLITGAIAGTAYTVTSGNINCTSAASASFTNAAQLVTPAVPTLTTTAATCSAAGSATVSNYSASITYTFTPTGPTVTTGGIITGATLGTAYTIKAGNGSCTSAASASFTNAAQLVTPAVPTLTTTTATCSAAGSATVSNYIASLTYTFTPSGPTVTTGGVITGATAGTAYTITAGNGSCNSAASASFTNAAQLVTPAVPSLTTTAATCSAAGSATVSNYIASLTYTFTPSGPTVTTGGVITGATAGTAYTITAGNGSCTSDASASFTNAAQLVTPAVPTVTTTAATCSAAGTTTVSNYNAALTYTFTPSGPTVTTGGLITGATAGTAYTVTAGNGSCASAASASFTNAAILAAPAAPTGSTNQTLTGGIASDVTIEDIVVTGSNGNWYATLANALANTNPLPVGTVLVSGTTYFTVSVSTNGCISSAALAVTVSITLSAESFEIENLTFYPNPVENQLNITASDVITKIEVYNLIGQQIKSISNNSNTIQIDLSELSSSTYIIKVYSEQKNQTIKVIKK